MSQSKNRKILGKEGKKGKKKRQGDEGGGKVGDKEGKERTEERLKYIWLSQVPNAILLYSYFGA